MANLITGLFDSETAAENAVANLKQISYNQNEISIIMKDRNAAAEVAHETGSRSMESAGTGAVLGGALGAILAGLLAVGSVAIPGVGLIAAGGFAAMLAGAGAGGIAGTVIGWLAGLGIPQDVAPYYERGLNEGGVVVAVAAHPGDEEKVRDIMRGGSVAYAGYAGSNIPSYVSPQYAARYSSINAPQHTYDSPNTTGWVEDGSTPEAQRTMSSINAEERSNMRTMAEHSREEERDAYRTNPVSGAVQAAKNEADRINTGLQNQADKASTGTQNEADRMKRP